MNTIKHRRPKQRSAKTLERKRVRAAKRRSHTLSAGSVSAQRRRRRFIVRRDEDRNYRLQTALNLSPEERRDLIATADLHDMTDILVHAACVRAEEIYLTAVYRNKVHRAIQHILKANPDKELGIINMYLRQLNETNPTFLEPLCNGIGPRRAKAVHLELLRGQHQHFTALEEAKTAALREREKKAQWKP